MIPWLEIAGLLVLLLIAWFWFDSFQSRAAGLAAAQAICRAEDLLLLDETVALAQLRLIRDDDGRLRLRRSYDFEFSDTGDNRRVGRVTLIGTTLLTVHLPERQSATCVDGRPPTCHRHVVE
ncbi:MAG: DUF3301 domain-containing protein [Candidatus Accumulibacter sp.]|nr:DUF3301 domain-containing protein [Accumulibacter sp.]